MHRTFSSGLLSSACAKTQLSEVVLSVSAHLHQQLLTSGSPSSCLGCILGQNDCYFLSVTGVLGAGAKVKADPRLAAGAVCWAWWHSCSLALLPAAKASPWHLCQSFWSCVTLYWNDRGSSTATPWVAMCFPSGAGAPVEELHCWSCSWLKR